MKKISKNEGPMMAPSQLSKKHRERAALALEGALKLPDSVLKNFVGHTQPEPCGLTYFTPTDKTRLKKMVSELDDEQN